MGAGALDKRKLTAVGGRVAGVGVGGLITGGISPIFHSHRKVRFLLIVYIGGVSFFSPEKGFACDNVVNMEVVLASGQIINANQTSNPDLFTALKGGSNNFGVVTRFDLMSFPRDNFWGGTILYPSSADVY